MKKTALTLLLAGALLSAGCSDSDDTVTASTPTPAQLTAEQLAAIQKEDKAALDQKNALNGITPTEASAAPDRASDALTSAPSATPKP